MLQKRRSRWFALSACVCIMVLLITAGCLRKPGKQPSTLTYRLPTTLTVAAGASLPGTDIKYDHMDDEGAHLLIGGQQALKRKGDSLDWAGEPVSGVSVDLKLRIVWYTETELRLAGTVKIKVEDAKPEMKAVTTSSPIKYGGAVVYGLAKDAAIPGTTVTFKGAADEGAELGGISGYPYRKVGDSILWEGKLRDNVYIRLAVRVLQFDEKGLRVGGLVTLWLGS